MSSLASLQFPRELQTLINVNQSAKEREKTISTAVIEQSIGEKFKAWADQHKEFVEASPMMLRIARKIAENEASKQSTQTQSVAQPFFQKQSPKQQICAEIEEHADMGPFTKESMVLLVEYFNIGALSFDQLKKMVSDKLSNNVEFFEISLPLLQILNPDETIDFLALKYGKDLAWLLCNEWSVGYAKRFLSQLSAEQIFKILSMADDENRMVLDIYTAVNGGILDLLPKLTPVQLATLLTLKGNLRNEQNPLVSALVDGDHFTIFKNLSLNELKPLLASCGEDRISPEFWQGAVPYLETLGFEKVQELVSAFSSRMFQDSIKGLEPLLKTYSAEQLMQLRDKKMKTIFHMTEKFTFDVLKGFSPEQFIQALSLQDSSGHIPLQNPEIAAEVGELLNYNTEKLQKIISTVKDREGNILFNQELIMSPGYAMFFFKFLGNSTYDQILSIFTIANNQGRSSLDLPGNIKTLLLLFKETRNETNLNKLVDTLSVKQKINLLNSLDQGNYEWPLFEILAPHIAAFPADQLLELLTSKNTKGINWFEQAFLVSAPRLNQLFTPLLDKCSTTQLAQLISSISNRIDLYRPEQIEKIMPFIRKAATELANMPAPSGDSLLNEICLRPSHTWLFQLKEVANFSIIDEKEYPERAAKLWPRFEKLWKTLTFGTGTGELNPAILEITMPDESKKLFTHKEIKDLMQVWFAIFIVNKTPWLGTPKEGTQALHQFYSNLLQLYEAIFDKVEPLEKNKNELAGYLVSLASPRLEGRCAAACEAEARQENQLLSGKNCDLNTFVTTAANAVLQTVIERIISQWYHSDSHSMIQFLYAMGLASQSDFLSHVSVDQAKRVMIPYWNNATIIKEFGHGLPDEIAIDWLKQRTPDDFGKEYIVVEAATKEKEAALMADLKLRLQGEKIPKEQVEAVLKHLPLFWGAKISTSNLKSAEKARLLKATFDAAADLYKLPILQRINLFIPDTNTFTRKDLSAAQEAIQKKLSGQADLLRQEALKQLDAQTETQAQAKALAEGKPPLSEQEKIALLPLLQRSQYVQQIKRFKDAENYLVSHLNALMEFENAVETMHLAPDNRMLFLKIKEEYEEELEKLGQELMFSDLNISFSRRDHGLPSRACDDARRLKYNEQHIASRIPMLSQILLKLGVLENILYP